MYFIKKMVYEPVTIYDKLIPLKENTRPGILMTDWRGNTIHNTGCPGVDWFTMRKSLTRNNHVKFSSYNDVMGFNAQIYRFIPITEISYTSGSFNYSERGKNYYDSKSYLYTNDMEVCTRYKNNFSPLQVENSSKWGAYHCILAELELKNFDRHMDIALDKPQCPEYLTGLRWKKCHAMARKFYGIIGEEAYMKKEKCSVVVHPESWNRFINKR